MDSNISIGRRNISIVCNNQMKWARIVLGACDVGSMKARIVEVRRTKLSCKLSLALQIALRRVDWPIRNAALFQRTCSNFFRITLDFQEPGGAPREQHFL